MSDAGIRVGTGLDVHPFAHEPRPLVLGGVVVAQDGGLAGHSDADVVAHALIDALLGAVALGDIGTCFGVETPELADADSLDLLDQAVGMVADQGWRIGNVDVTVVAQWPQITPHVEAMRAGIAEVLGVSGEQVGVKATSADRLGSIGRGEGIACWVTVLVHAA